MEKFGYVRVSTADQNEERQVKKMLEIGVDERRILVEKESGKNFADRPVYQLLAGQMLRAGDLLYIDSIDRLGRNYEEVKDEWRRLTREIGADVVALDMPEIFDSRSFRAQGDIGKLLEDQMLSLLAWVAEQERKKIRTRQREGVENAKRAGKYKGRKPKRLGANAEEAAQIYDDYIRRRKTKTEIAKALKIACPTLDRLIKEYETELAGGD